MLTKEHLPVLHDLRERIDSGADRFLCLALEYIDSPEADDIWRCVEAEFVTDNRNTINDWLIDQMFPGVPYKSLPEPYFSISQTAKAAAPMRLAWIDRQIANIEEAK